MEYNNHKLLNPKLWPNKLWNCQQDDWPNFKYDKSKLDQLVTKFVHNYGIEIGASSHLTVDNNINLIIEASSSEAISTSAIEGEYLNRDSVRSSIRKYFSLQATTMRSTPLEAGIAEMMVDLYKTYDHKLDHESLFRWHRMVTNGRQDLENIGAYRTHIEPMQIMSGKYGDAKVHFEAPPSVKVAKEMNRLIDWYNQPAKDSEHIIIKAGIAHLYFESIHPFEDGNGCIGRALSLKLLSSYYKKPTLLDFSYAINKKKKLYYDALEKNTKELQITDWLEYFLRTCQKITFTIYGSCGEMI